MLLVGIIKHTFSQRFFFARLTRMPLLGGIVDRLFFEHDDIVYLPMDRVVTINKKLGEPEQTVLPSALVDRLIDQANHHWVMDRCICRDANHCQDYPVGLGCMFLGEASLHINPKLGRRVSKKEAHEHARRCREAGLVHLIGRNKLDTVWLGVGPGHRLLTICNCCPCCCLWKMLPDLSPHISSKVRKMPGVEVVITDRCVGCGRCAQSCFVSAIRVVEGRASIGGDCRGCGRCASICPKNAIRVSIDDGLVEAAHIAPSVDVS